MPEHNVATDREKMEQIRKLASQVFEGEAYTRFMTVLHTKPELAQQALQIAMMRVQKMGLKVTDESLVMILRSLSSGRKRESKISFRRK